LSSILHSNLTPACLMLLGNLTATMQATGNLWGFLCLLCVCILSFFFQYTHLYCPWNQEPLSPFAFSTLGTAGAKQSSI
jgi:hypothetical protein